MDTVICPPNTVPARSARSGTATRRRRCQVGVRLTTVERAAVEERAAAAGIGAADYLRRAGLGTGARLRRPAPTVARATLDALRALAGQAALIGNNINQVARAVNVAVKAGEEVSPDVTVVRDVTAALDGLRADLRRALGVAGVGDPPCS
jgi:hypothetical protein